MCIIDQNRHVQTLFADLMHTIYKTHFRTYITYLYIFLTKHKIPKTIK